jgi:Icc-related predicted phosphoesterase
MARLEGVYVQECQSFVIFVNFVRRDFSFDDFGKNTVVHSSIVTRCISYAWRLCAAGIVCVQMIETYAETLPVGLAETGAGRLSRLLGVAKRAGSISARVALTGGLMTVGGIGAMETWGEASSDIGPATVTAEANFGFSGDVIGETSIGMARVDLTDGPIGMKVRMTHLDKNAPQAVQEELDTQARVQAASFKPGEALTPYKDKIYDLSEWAGRKGALAGLAGMLGGALLAESSWALGRTVRRREIPDRDDLVVMGARSVLLPMFALYATVGWGASTYNEEAFNHPQFGNDSFGELVDFVSKSMATREKYVQGSEYLDEWLNDLLAYQQYPEAPLKSTGLIPVLVMSDAHERTCVYDLAKALIDRFDVAFVINAGDDKDGNPLLITNLVSSENCQADTLEELGRPVVVAPGNHDSPEHTRQIDAYKNVTVLGENTTELAIDTPRGRVRFRITGGPDPRYTPDFSQRPLLEVERQVVTEFGERVGRIALRDRADIIVVHDPLAGEAAAKFMGEQRDAWIFQGHAHRFNLDVENHRLTVGSIGGSGLRSLEYEHGEEQGASQATLVYFDPDTKQPVRGFNFSVETNGRSTAEPIFFDPSINADVMAKQAGR